MDDLTRQIQPSADRAIPAEQQLPDEIEQWRIATATLRQMLESSDGVVSSWVLRPELERRGVENARKMVIKLKLFNFDNPDPDLITPTFRYHYRGRSFYSEQAHSKAEAETVAAADKAGQEVETDENELEEEEAHVKKPNRQEEARLCKYVEAALENLYASDFGPDEVKVAYDIHNERPGTEFENMDVIAIHWRSNEVVELIAVEVKLEFSPRLILQAGNYKRFAHRVWVALPVSSDEPGIELREYDPLLFEHVLEEGIGVLACRRKQGGAYGVQPVQWPRLNRLDSISKDAFIKRYRNVFEEAQVVKKQAPNWSPQLR